MPARRASHGRLERLVHHVVGASGGAPARPLTQQQRRDYKLDTQYRQRMDELGLVVPEEFRAPYHTAEGLAREDILDWRRVQEQWDEEAFMRDGVAIFRGIFTPAATRRLVESCENVQRHNDRWLDHDWHEPSQWEALGLRGPTEPPLTEEEKATARGGCQLLWSTLGRILNSVRDNNPDHSLDLSTGLGQLRDARSMRWPLGTGVVPEHCPMAYDQFLSDCITHRQMIEVRTPKPPIQDLTSPCWFSALTAWLVRVSQLHKLMLGPEVRFDHNTLLSRRSFTGQHWHSQ